MGSIRVGSVGSDVWDDSFSLRGRYPGANVLPSQNRRLLQEMSARSTVRGGKRVEPIEKCTHSTFVLFV